MKYCKWCKTFKHLDNFYKEKLAKDGLRSKCKECFCEDTKRRCLARYYKNKKLYAEKHKLYSIKNREKLNQYNSIYRKKKKQEDFNFRLRCALRSRLSNAIRTHKTGSAITDLGCSLDELRNYLESKFQKDMTWKNYGKHGWHIDHIKPLSSFDLSDRSQLAQACHYTNLQPLWAIDNLRKGTKLG